MQSYETTSVETLCTLSFGLSREVFHHVRRSPHHSPSPQSPLVGTTPDVMEYLGVVLFKAVRFSAGNDYSSCTAGVFSLSHTYRPRSPGVRSTCKNALDLGVPQISYIFDDAQHAGRSRPISMTEAKNPRSVFGRIAVVGNCAEKHSRRAPR